MVTQQHQPALTDSLVKPSMSRTLVYRTNKEFDKCAELLRNILSVQGKINKCFFSLYIYVNEKNLLFKESRRNSKSSIIGEGNRKNQSQPPQSQQQQSQVNIRPKKQTPKATVTKTSFIKTSMFIYP